MGARPSADISVYQVALLPGRDWILFEAAPGITELSFRKHLRTMVGEIGRGVTVIAPSEYVSGGFHGPQFVIQYPKLTQNSFVFPPDGQINNVYVMLQNTNLS